MKSQDGRNRRKKNNNKKEKIARWYKTNHNNNCTNHNGLMAGVPLINITQS